MCLPTRRRRMSALVGTRSPPASLCCSATLLLPVWGSRDSGRRSAGRRGAFATPTRDPHLEWKRTLWRGKCVTQGSDQMSVTLLTELIGGQVIH